MNYYFFVVVVSLLQTWFVHSAAVPALKLLQECIRADFCQTVNVWNKPSQGRTDGRTDEEAFHVAVYTHIQRRTF